MPYNRGTLDAYREIRCRNLKVVTGSSSSGSATVTGTLTVIGTISGSNYQGISATGLGDMLKSDYATSGSKVVDHAVDTDYFSGLNLTTVRTHSPASHGPTHTSGSTDAVSIYKNQIIDINNALSITGSGTSSISGSLIVTGSISGSSLLGTISKSQITDFSNYSLTIPQLVVTGSAVSYITGAGLVVTGYITGADYYGPAMHIQTGSATTFARRIVNITNAGGMIIQMTDDGANDRINLSLQSTGSGGGGGSFANYVSSSYVYGQTALVGDDNTMLARADHVHGTPGLYELVPTDVSGSSAAGTSTSGSHGDHYHRGVLSLANSGSSALYSRIYLTGSPPNIVVTQSGQVIQTALSSALSGLTNIYATNVSGSMISGSTFSGSTAVITNAYVTNLSGSGTVSGSTLRGSNAFVTTLTATNITGSLFSGSNAAITNINSSYITGSTISGSTYIGNSAIFTTLTATTYSGLPSTTIVTPASFIVYSGSDGLYYTTSGSTGQVAYSGSSATIAIQTALSKLVSNGGLAFLKNGIYYTNATLSISGSKIHLCGEGIGSEIYLLNNSNCNVINITGSGVIQCKLNNFQIYGNKSNQSGTSYAIYINTPYVAYDSMHVIEDIDINEPLTDGIHISGDTRASLLSRIHVNASGQHSFSLGGSDDIIIGCIAEAAIYNGFNVFNSDGHYIGCKAFGCGIGGGTYSGFYIGQATGVRYTDCEAQDNKQAGWLCENSLATTQTLVNCVAENNGRTGSGIQDGVSLWTGSKISIIGGLYYDTGVATQTRGIRIWGGTDSALVTGVQVYGNITAQITNTSTAAATNKIFNNIGYKTENSGTTTITAGQTSSAITHGLAAVPNYVNVNPMADTRWWVSNTGSATFQINIPVTLASDLICMWKAEV
jgi:hypothetical protein